MSDDSLLFANKYRIPSTRLRGWDYGAGAYFVTICTYEKIPWFGHIEYERMWLSDVGNIVDYEWNKTAHIRSHVTLDRYIVMPDHFHAIITINQSVETPRWGVSGTNQHRNIDQHQNIDFPNNGNGVLTNDGPLDNTTPETPHRGVSTKTNTSFGRKSQWNPGCLGAIINQFKSVCTKHIRDAGYPDFAWQPRFHDHIIRTESELIRIRTYITNNPSKSKHDELFD